MAGKYFYYIRLSEIGFTCFESLQLSSSEQLTDDELSDRFNTAVITTLEYFVGNPDRFPNADLKIGPSLSNPDFYVRLAQELKKLGLTKVKPEASLNFSALDGIYADRCLSPEGDKLQKAIPEGLIEKIQDILEKNRNKMLGIPTKSDSTD